jgi:hypothetical protein
MTSTPVALIVFNRPQLTERTFAVIRAQRPNKLFLIADGPRVNHPTDGARCAAVRAILENVDWPCEVYRDYSDHNLGCKYRPKTGIDWVFQHVDKAIILEDDCLPHADFFSFCDLMLERYAADERISLITGNNFQDGQWRGNASYYFSRYPHTWGWATWARAWQYNEADIGFWPEWKRSVAWRRFWNDRVAKKYWTDIFDRVHSKLFETAWDYPWVASVWRRGGLTVTPNVNLISNIGFGPDATHTLSADSNMAAMIVNPLSEIRHPNQIVEDEVADRYDFDHAYGGKHLRGWQYRRRLLRAAPGVIYRKILAFIKT